MTTTTQKNRQFPYTQTKHPSFLTAAKYAILTGMATVTFLTSCDSKPVQTTPTTTIEVTKPTYPLYFELRLSEMRSAGNGDIADKIFSLYESEPQVAYSLSFLAHPNIHPALAELLMQQPWYLDGLSDSERIFINYGLGNGEQGIASMKGLDDILEKIIVNQQYVLDKVELNGRTKNIVLLYDRADDAVSRENIDLTMKLVKASALETEKLNGAKYPLQAITVFANYIENWTSAAGNGIMNLALNPEGIGKNGVRTLLEEEAHVIICSRKGGDVASKSWIDEGFANFSATYVQEKLSQSTLSWWKSAFNYPMQEMYADFLAQAKREGVFGTPLAGLKTESHNAAVAMGFLFMKDLYGVMGNSAYTRMMSGIYDYQTAHPPKPILVSEIKPGDYSHLFGEKLLEEYALNSCPNDAVKANVQKLFDARVWDN